MGQDRIFRDFSASAADGARITSSEKPVVETECLLFSNAPRLVDGVLQAVLEGSPGYTLLSDPTLVPPLPRASMPQPAFRPPLETTPVRQRVYCADSGGVLAALGLEVRLEERKGGKGSAWCQTAKWIEPISKEGGAFPESCAVPVFHRMEQKAILAQFGFNPYALRPRALRERVLEAAFVDRPRPVLCLTSQRTRLCYHPDGDTATLIELAAEPSHVGVTFSGFSWQAPKLELEIKKGPDNPHARTALLCREVHRLQSLAERIAPCAPPLRPSTHSSAAPGFAAVAAVLATAQGRRDFAAIDPRAWPPLAVWIARAGTPAPDPHPSKG